MTHRKRAIWTERLLLGLILASLGATLNLVLAVHRHSANDLSEHLSGPIAPQPAQSAKNSPSPQSSDIAATSAFSPDLKEPPGPEEAPNPPAPPEQPPPAEDPTRQRLAVLASAAAREIEATRQADRRAETLEAARKQALAESHLWKRRELLVRQQIDELAARADRLEQDAEAVAAERDVLEHERDVLKAALAKASRKSGFAVLPYKGPNGTWRRPVVLECTGSGVKLLPQGQVFSGLELSPRIHPRASPIVRAVARELFHIQSADTPDGAPAVPYLVFLVRPNGIRPYYEARASLESLGIAFGYELIDQDFVVNVPNLDDLSVWDGTVPLDLPLEAAARPDTALAMNDANGDGRRAAASLEWPRGGLNSQGTSGRGSGRRAGGQPGAPGGNSEDVNPGDFVWPARPGPALQPGGPATGAQAPGSSVPGSAAAFAGSEGLEGGATQTGAGASGGSFGSPGNPLLSSGSRSGASGSVGGFGSTNGPSPAERFLPGGGANGSGPNFFGAGGGTFSGANQLGASSAGTAGQGLAHAGGNTRSGVAGAGSSLPELEPAGDGGLNPPVQPPSGSTGTDRLGSSFGSRGGVSGLGPGSVEVSVPSMGGTGAQGSDSAAGSPALGVPSGIDPVGSASTAEDGDRSLARNGGSGSEQPDAQPGGAGSGGSPTSGDTSELPLGQGTGSQSPPTNPPALGAGVYSRSNPSSTSPAPDTSSLSGLGSLASSNVDAHTGGGSSTGTVVQGSQGLDNLALESSASGSSSAGSSSSNLGAGLPSSLSSSASANTSSTMQGLPLGLTSPASPMSQSSPSFSFGEQSSSSSTRDKSDEFNPPHIIPQTQPPGSIEVPFEIVVVCREKDILLHPGAYRLTTKALLDPRGNRESLLAREIRAMVRRRAIVDPLIRPRPSIKFLVESQGGETFWLARRQLLFALPNWPLSLAVSGSHDMHVFDKPTW